MLPTAPHDPLRTADPAPDVTLSNPSGTVDAATTADAAHLPPTIPGYELLGVLGRGGMGVVYQARHLALKRTVALKMILSGGHAGAGELARFRTEAEAVARLQHPNIVQVHEVGDAAGHPYLALEFVEGGTLAARIAAAPLPAADAAKLVSELARAMQLAHSRNVVHRDLKPGNVLFAADGTPKIADFGLARQLDTDSGQTLAGSVVGTPSYMAPEQAAGRGHEAGPAADVYALGAILYACLSGRPPFKGATVVETLDLVRTAEPPPPLNGTAAVPPDLATVCLKCLRKPPEQRYASAAELADDLDRYRRGEPIQARPVGQLERAAKWARRHPVAAALVAAVSLLVIGIPTAAVVFAEVVAGKNRDLVDKNGELVRKERERASEVARQVLNHALYLCDQGDVPRGLVELTRALAAAVEAEDADLESAARLNLAAWERQTWRLKAVLSGRDGTHVWASALAPDGTVLAVALANGTTEMWDARDGSAGRVLHALPHDGLVVSLSFSGDGRLLLTRTDRTVHLWVVATGRPACPPLRHASQVTAAALAPDGSAVLTGERDGTARLWDAATGAPRGDPFAHKSPVSAASFRADGSQALTASLKGNVQVWGVSAGRADGRSFALKSSVVTAVFGGDGKTILAATRGDSSGAVHLLDAASGEPVRPPLVSDSPVEEAVFAPGDATLAVRTALGPAAANARLWQAATGQPVAPAVPHPGAVWCTAFSPDGRMLLTAGGGGSARLWDAGSGAAAGPPLYHVGDVRAAAFSRDGRTLMTLDGAVRLWQAPLGFRRGPPLPHPGGASAVAFTRDGKFVLTGGADGTARLWHTATGEPASAPLGHGSAVLAVAVSPDGRLAVTGDATNTARLWELPAGKPCGVLEGHRSGVVAIAFSPDGRLVLTGSEDATARLWDVATRRPVGEPLTHGHPVDAVTFSADGGTAYTAERDGTEVRRWDTATGRPREGAGWRPGGVRAVAVAPAGGLLLTGSADRTARFWSVHTGEQVGPPLQHQDTVRSVAFGPDGRSALTGGFDSTARRWHAPTGIPIGPPFVHSGRIRAVALSPDGRTAGTASWDGTAVLWEAPPARTGTPDQLALRAQLITGIELDDGRALRGLDTFLWQERLQRLGTSTADPDE